MSEMIRELSEQGEGPLCPQHLYGPMNPLHEAATRAIDAVYAKAPRDDDGEVAEGPAADVLAALNARVDSRMNLHVARASWHRLGRNHIVEAYYFLCPTCGFVLPAQEVRYAR